MNAIVAGIRTTAAVETSHPGHGIRVTSKIVAKATEIQ
jgi:hypothetical protein